MQYTWTHQSSFQPTALGCIVIEDTFNVRDVSSFIFFSNIVLYVLLSEAEKVMKNGLIGLMDKIVSANLMKKR